MSDVSRSRPLIQGLGIEGQICPFSFQVDPTGTFGRQGLGSSKNIKMLILRKYSDRVSGTCYISRQKITDWPRKFEMRGYGNIALNWKFSAGNCQSVTLIDI